MITSRFVRVHYCDDVRQEVGGKYSLMGCYNAFLLLQVPTEGEAVVALPKLCAAIEIVSPVDQPLGALTVRALLNDELLGELTVTREQFAANPENMPKVSEPTWQGVNAFMTFAPLIVGTGGGKLQIEVDTGEGVLKSNSLLIIVNGESPGLVAPLSPQVAASATNG